MLVKFVFEAGLPYLALRTAVLASTVEQLINYKRHVLIYDRYLPRDEQGFIR